MLLEDRGGAEHPGVEELEDRPELAQVVLDRRAAHGQPVPPLEQPGRLGRLAVGVLDRLRLVQDHVIEGDLAQLDDVGPEGPVGGDDQVVVGELVAGGVAVRPGVVEDPEPRAELLGLGLPVEDQRPGDDDQARPPREPPGPPALEQGEDLHGLAQAHVVGQDAAEVELLEVFEPAQALALVGPQLAPEAGRGLLGVDPLEPGEVLADLAEADVELDLGLRRQERVEEPGLRLAEPDRAVLVLGAAEVGEHPVLLEPVLREHPHRAVAQRDHRLAPAGRGQEVGQGDGLAAEVNLAAQLEPVDPGGHGQLELAGLADQLPLGLDPPAGLDQLLGHLGDPLGGQLQAPGVEQVVLGVLEAQLVELDARRLLAARPGDGRPGSGRSGRRCRRAG